MRSEEERFLSKVEFIPFHECWEWNAGVNPDGYGVFRSKKYQVAHRFAFEYWNKTQISPGLVIDHKCKNKTCVNPDHLRQVTLAINTTENSLSPSALNKIKTHCLRGHPFNESNTDLQANNQRRCRKCAALRARKYRAKRR
jgi:hypothetical protein